MQIDLGKTKEMRDVVKQILSARWATRPSSKFQNSVYTGSHIANGGSAQEDAEKRIQKAGGAFCKLKNSWRSTWKQKWKCLMLAWRQRCCTSPSDGLCLRISKRHYRLSLTSAFGMFYRSGGFRKWLTPLWPLTGQSDINLEIRRREFVWLGHTLRKGYDEIPSTALTWNPQGGRKRWRPKTDWHRTVGKEILRGYEKESTK